MRLVLVAVALSLFLIGAALAADWQITQLDNGLKSDVLENHQVPQVNVLDIYIFISYRRES